MKTKRLPVHIAWVDSSLNSGWIRPEDMPTCAHECETLGWIVDENKEFITIALNRVIHDDSTHPFGHIVTIPKVAIIKRKSIRT